MSEDKQLAIRELAYHEVFLVVMVTPESEGKQTVKVVTNNYNDAYLLCKEALELITKELSND
jgi:hypothetical protein